VTKEGKIKMELDGRFYREIGTSCQDCRIVEILPEHMESLKQKIREVLSNICYGARTVEEDPEFHTYKKACAEIAVTLNSKKKERRHGFVGELLMHIIVPEVFGTPIISLSVLLSLVDRNIKHGFDINFYEINNNSVWYGEVKTGVGTTRSSLIGESKKGLNIFFTGLSKDGKGNTAKRWDAAKAEIAAIFYEKDNQKFSALIQNSRDSIMRGEKGKNAVIMTANFGDIRSQFSDIKDINKALKKIDNQNMFDKRLIISLYKEIYEDIVDFIFSEGEE